MGEQLEDLESELREQMADLAFVGALELDDLGPRCEDCLPGALSVRSVGQLRRAAPRTFVAYLVWQGLHNYEASTFWEHVSVDALQAGQEVGPEFMKALRGLGLSTFDDLELAEGIGVHTRNRYIRRIHLHGGIPRDSLDRVLGLLYGTMRRSGARTPADAIESWLSSGALEDMPVAARRVLAYTGDFGVAIVEQLIRLLDEASRGGDLSRVGAPTFIEVAVREFMERPHTASWNFRPGPVVRLDRFTNDGPVLEIPAGDWERWMVNAVDRAESSRQRAVSVPLGPPDGPGWTVTSSGGARRHFASLDEAGRCYVFDDRGRLQRPGVTIRSLRAAVVCPSQWTVMSEVDRHQLTGPWSGFDLVVADLRNREALSISDLDAEMHLACDAHVAVELVGDVVDGLAWAGVPLSGTTVGLRFTGFVPRGDDVVVTVRSGAQVSAASIDSLPERDGAFSLAPLLPDEHFSRAEISVGVGGQHLKPLGVARIPGLVSRLPPLAGPDEAIVAPLQCPAGWTGPSTVVLEPGQDTCVLTLQPPAGPAVQIEAVVPRVRWAVAQAGGVPLLGTDPVALRLDVLAEHHLTIWSGGVPVRVVVGGNQEQHAWVRPGAGGAVVTVPLRTFADTVRASEAAHCGLSLDLGGGSTTIPLGVIESRFEPWDLWATAHCAERTTLLAGWEERATWPDRVARVWSGGADPAIIAEWSIPEQDRTIEVELETPPSGRYLFEVTAKRGWSAPSVPRRGAGAIALHLGNRTAIRLQEAIAAGNRRERFTDDELDELIPVLADLVVDLLPATGQPSEREVLTEHVLDEASRAVEVVLEVAAHLDVDAFGVGRERVEPHVLHLLPYLFDAPIRGASVELAEALEELWQVAPMVAAVVDAPLALDDDACEDRWVYAAGIGPVGREPHKVLDKLTRQVPNALDARDSEDPRLLHAVAWTAALIELREASSRTVARRRWDQAQSLVRKVGTQPNWVGTSGRIRKTVQGVCAGAGWLPDLVTLSCAYLDTNTPQSLTAQIEPVLLETHEFAPTAVRTSIVLAAGALRALEHVPQRRS